MFVVLVAFYNLSKDKLSKDQIINLAQIQKRPDMKSDLIKQNRTFRNLRMLYNWHSMSLLQIIIFHNLRRP